MSVVLIAVVGGSIAIFLLTALIGAPYVPSHSKELRATFKELRPLTSNDVLIDIGSGDGIVLKEAIQAGAGAAIGYEINPILAVIALLRLRTLRGRARVQLANFWRVSFPAQTSVVYTFGESRDIAKMYKKVEQEATRLNRKIDFISYAFRVPGHEYAAQRGAHYLYIVSPLQ